MTDWPPLVVRFGGRRRAPYAADPAQSRGRFHAEPESLLRSPFQRDRDRILHCNAFRRLKHKTQVFIHHEDDHFRTRLTHTLEVAQIARSIARPLGLDEDLAEALALAHDLGHPPFGHAGERALQRALAAHQGFDHNAQSLRVVTELERRYPTFDGLNLTWETLEGLVKHNGPIRDAAGRPAGPYAGGVLPYAMRAFAELDALDLDRHPSLEAQVAALADDIAYDSHDVEDGIRSGLLRLEDLREQPVTGPILAAVAAEFPGLERARTAHELVRRMIMLFIEDVIAETARRLAALAPRSADDVRAAGGPVAALSPPLAGAERDLKAFLFDNLYRHAEVRRTVALAEGVVVDLFAAFAELPDRLPADWRGDLDPGDRFAVARRAADYIAGMTDRFALTEHRRLFDATPDLG